MRQRKIPEPVLVELGLVIPRREGGGFFDRFRHRIMFPIRNTLGRVIAFGGRALDPKENAKYLNSNDTPLFNKSKVLYLLDRAKECLKDRGAVLVEGYMDAISLHMRGFSQAVASLGTALTLDHIQILRRYTKDFILLYDGDSAGIHAAMRGVELFFESGLPVRAALLPQGMDPDDFIQANGPEAMQHYLDEASDGFDFYVRQAALNRDMQTTQGKMETMDQLLPLFAKIDDPLLHQDCVHHLSLILASDADVIESTIQKRMKKQKISAPTASTVPPAVPRRDPYAIIKEPLIRLLAFQRGLLTTGGDVPLRSMVLFPEEELKSRLPPHLRDIYEKSFLDSVLGRLLKTENLPNQTNVTTHLSQLFPETELLAAYIGVVENEPLPSSEVELRKMRDELYRVLQEESQRKLQQKIMKEKETDPRKALQALNDLLLSKPERS